MEKLLIVPMMSPSVHYESKKCLLLRVNHGKYTETNDQFFCVLERSSPSLSQLKANEVRGGQKEKVRGEARGKRN